MFCQKCGSNLGTRSANFCVYCGSYLNYMGAPSKPVTTVATQVTKHKVVKKLDTPFYPILEKQKIAKKHLSSALLFVLAAFFFIITAVDVVNLAFVDVYKDWIGSLSEMFSYTQAIIADMIVYFGDIVASLFVSLSLFSVFFCSCAEEGNKATRRALSMLRISLWCKFITCVIEYAISMYTYGMKIKLAFVAENTSLATEHIMSVIAETVGIVLTFVFILLLCKSIKCFKKNLAGKEYKKRVSVVAIVVSFIMSASWFVFALVFLFALAFVPDLECVYYLTLSILNLAMTSLLGAFLIRYRVAISKIDKRAKNIRTVVISPKPAEAPQEKIEATQETAVMEQVPESEPVSDEATTLFAEVNTETEI